jgi:hypothetical protein
MRSCFGAILAVAAAALLGLPAVALGAGTVSGTVEPVAAATEVEVCVVETLPSETCTVPDLDGTYALTGLALQPLRIEFLPSYRSRLLPQYYDHKSSLAEAATISLTPLSPSAENIDADLILGGQVEGTIVNEAATPLAEVEVCALTGSRQLAVACVETDSGGHYSLPTLPTGIYKIAFRGRGESADYTAEYYGGGTTFASATSVAVLAGETTTGIGGELGKGAELTGEVTAALSGVGLENIAVCLFAPAASDPERCIYTDEDGHYALRGIASGAYQVGFSLGSAAIGGEGGEDLEDGYMTQYYRGVANRSEAEALSLLAPASLAGIDAALSPSPSPLPPSPPPLVPDALEPTPPPISAPPLKKKRCRHGFRKKKVKGKIRCVRIDRKKGRGRAHAT